MESRASPTLLRWLPRGLARAARHRRTPGAARHPREGLRLLPSASGGFPQTQIPRHTLLGRNPGMRMFSKHARRLRVSSRTPGMGIPGWFVFRVQVLVRHTLPTPLSPPKNKNQKAKKLRWMEDF